MRSTGGQHRRNAPELAVRSAFARVLVELRENAGLKQAEVAERSGYEEKYVSALERRKHTPTLTAIIALSGAIGVSPLLTVGRVLELLPKFRRPNSE
jgi:transcriptional regulator with XRE-family HTH domain